TAVELDGGDSEYALGDGLRGRVSEKLLDGTAVRIGAWREALREIRKTPRIVRIGTVLPDVAKELLAHMAARRAAFGSASDGETQQGERIEGMLRRCPQHDAVAMRLPVHMTRGPCALGLDFGGALLAPMGQHA